MLFHQTARAGLRAARLSSVAALGRRPAPQPALAVRAAAAAGARSGFHSSPAVREPEKKGGNDATPSAGSYARTDESITVEYPPDNELPSSVPVEGAGRAGVNVLPTLAAFSLEGTVSVVTGGARGLGLVMGQGIVISGGELAIVDLNSRFR